MNTPQTYPLYLTIEDERYLIVGWTDYHVPIVVPLNKPTKAKAGVPKPDAEVTYSLQQPIGITLR